MRMMMLLLVVLAYINAEWSVKLWFCFLFFFFFPPNPNPMKRCSLPLELRNIHWLLTIPNFIGVQWCWGWCCLTAAGLEFALPVASFCWSSDRINESSSNRTRNWISSWSSGRFFFLHSSNYEWMWVFVWKHFHSLFFAARWH